MAITTATQAAQIVNQSLKTLGYDFAIDTASSQTIEDGFKQIGAFAPSALSRIMEQCVTILVFRNYGTMFNESKNPTRALWRDFINYGGGEEDIFHEIIESENGYWADDFADKDDLESRNFALEIAKDLTEYKKPSIRKKFHTDFETFRIKLSRSDLEISSVFTPEGFIRFVDTQMANVQWSAEAKLQSIAIEQLKKMATDGNVVYFEGYNPNTTNGVTSIVETLRTIGDGMQTLTDAFNVDKVKNISSFEDLYMIATPEFVNRISVRGYANAYNLAQYKDNNRYLEVPYGTDFGTSPNGEKILAMLVDRRAIVLALRYWNMMPFNVSNTDYINFFLKVKCIKGYNEFFNAVAITGNELDFFVEPPINQSLIYTNTDVNLFINGVEKPLGYDETIAVPYGSVVEINDVQMSGTKCRGSLDGDYLSGAEKGQWTVDVGTEFVVDLPYYIMSNQLPANL